MSNAFEQDLAKVGKVAVGIVDGEYILDGVKYLGKAAAVFATAIKDQPALKTALTTVAKDGAKIVGELGSVIAEKGINWTDDQALVSQVTAFLVSDLNGMLFPLIEKIFGELKTDVVATPAAPAPTTTVA
jgi:hypothetical protein